MRSYLDDDSAGGLLAQLLQQAGHDVQRPRDVGKAGEDDSVHLAHAIREDRVLLSRNYRDFENLHDLVLAAKGHHAGILVVRKDNNPRRDLTDHGIVRAIGKLLVAQVPIADQFIVLNHWR
jgi:predicted nuclease of predicted toxin-antitoxin system